MVQWVKNPTTVPWIAAEAWVQFLSRISGPRTSICHGCGHKNKRKPPPPNPKFFVHFFKKSILGVLVVAQQVRNPTSIHEDTGSIPGLA